MDFVSFESLGLHHSIIKALYEMQYAEPTPVQQQAIPLAISGKDLLVSSQTGSGKTAAFILPILHRFAMQLDETREKGFNEFAQRKKRKRGDSRKASRRRPATPRMVVLTPTRELATQIVTASRRFSAYLGSIMTVAILGGMPYPKQLQLLGMNPDILVATPGRLIDHIKSGRIDLGEIEVLVLDEADRMLDMGFIEDIRFIASQTHECHQTMLFSATLDGLVGSLAEELTYEAVSVHIDAMKESNEHIEQSVHYVDDMAHKERLLNHWLRDASIRQSIVFTATKKDTEALAERLLEFGIPAAPMHGDMPQFLRNRTLERLRKGHIKILIATDVAARGIDVPDISHVFNFDMPMSPEDYVHRIGRTGRAGRDGIAISLVNPGDKPHLKRIERFLDTKIPVTVIPGFEPKKSGKAPQSRRKKFHQKRGGWPAEKFANQPSNKGTPQRKPQNKRPFKKRKPAAKD